MREACFSCIELRNSFLFENEFLWNLLIKIDLTHEEIFLYEDKLLKYSNDDDFN